MAERMGRRLMVLQSFLILLCFSFRLMKAMLSMNVSITSKAGQGRR